MERGTHRGRAVLKADQVTDLVTQLDAHLMRHARRDAHGSHAARLRAPDAAQLGVAGLVQVLRQLRGLAWGGRAIRRGQVTHQEVISHLLNQPNLHPFPDISSCHSGLPPQPSPPSPSPPPASISATIMSYDFLMLLHSPHLPPSLPR